MRFPWIRRSDHEAVIAEWRLELAKEIDKNRRADTAYAAQERALNRAQDEARFQFERAAELLAAGQASEAKVVELVGELFNQLESSPVPVVESCIACSAKDQTIALMADVVDFERARSVQMPQRPAAEAAVRPLVVPTRPEDVEERKWVTDEEEAIMGALQSGALGADPEEAYERASKMLAAVGAQNVEVQVVK